MLDFHMGIVLDVDYTNNKVFVSSSDAGGQVTLLIDSPLSLQEMPDMPREAAALAQR